MSDEEVSDFYAEATSGLLPEQTALPGPQQAPDALPSRRMTRPEHEPLPGPMYVTIGGHGGPAVGYTWRIWTSATSFYMKSRAPGMKHLKLSLHGDDPRHPRGGGFKMAMDTDEAWEQDVASGVIIGQRTGDWPIWCPGRSLNENSTLVARLRWTYDAIARLGPAPDPGDLKRGAKGLVVKAPPEPGYAVDVDLVVSELAPYWLSEPRVRRDNACLGPLFNEPTGLWLTGTAVKRFVPHYPHPVDALGPKPTSRDDQVRGVAGKVDRAGFLWLVEHRMSRDNQLPGDASAQPAPRPE